MKRTFIRISMRGLALVLLTLFSGCPSSPCASDSSGIVQGDQFRITVLSMTSSSASCAAPSLPAGTSYVIVAGPGDPAGGGTCPPILHSGKDIIPSPAFDSDQLTSCSGPGIGGGELGFACSGKEASGCAIDAYVVFNSSAGRVDAGDTGSMSVSWVLTGCGQAQCDQSYDVQIDRLGGSDAGPVTDDGSKD